jgi:peptidoglycan/xylan/chitin deacetylase (PgdA/CDA1 family)
MKNRTAAWPQNTRCGVVVTVNFDAESVDLHETTPDNLYGKFSYGRYGMRAGIWRLLDVFGAHGLKTTFFIPGLDAENNPAAIERILKDGHEVAARGYAFEDHSKLGATEKETLQKAHDALKKATGKTPAGWRAPFGMLSPQTLNTLADMGYAWDSSFQDDDLPYVMKSPTGKQIVELPSFQYLDDSTLYLPRHSHIRVLKTWKEEFDAIYNEGLYVNLTLHPRGDWGSGRTVRAMVVDEFINYMAGFPGVQFQTCGELAGWWKKNHTETEPVAPATVT